ADLRATDGWELLRCGRRQRIPVGSELGGTRIVRATRRERADRLTHGSPSARTGKGSDLPCDARSRNPRRGPPTTQRSGEQVADQISGRGLLLWTRLDMADLSVAGTRAGQLQ